MKNKLLSIDYLNVKVAINKKLLVALGGKRKAKEALYDVIDRYFTEEYIDWEFVKLS